MCLPGGEGDTVKSEMAPYDPNMTGYDPTQCNAMRSKLGQDEYSQRGNSTWLSRRPLPNPAEEAADLLVAHPTATEEGFAIIGSPEEIENYRTNPKPLVRYHGDGYGMGVQCGHPMTGHLYESPQLQRTNIVFVDT